MAENSDVTDRLKKEGQLTRNTGTNSIKSVNTRLDKFSSVFASIEMNLISQTTMMQETLKLQIENAETAKRMDQINALNENRKSVNETDILNTSGKKTEGNSILSNLGLLSLGGMGPARIAGMLLRGGVLAVVAPAVAEFVGDFIGQSLKNFDFSQATIDTTVQGAERGVFGAAILGTINRRLAVPGFLAGFASSFSDELLTSMGFTQEEMDRVITNVGGFDVTTENVAQGVLGLGGALAPRLLRSFAGLRLGAATAVLGLYITYGDEAKKYLENVGLPEGLSNIAVDGLSFAATGASLGSMFGPTGMLVGAALGLAVGLGWSVYNWMERNKEKARQEAERRTNELNEAFGFDLDPESVVGEIPDVPSATPDSQRVAGATLSVPRDISEAAAAGDEEAKEEMARIIRETVRRHNEQYAFGQIGAQLSNDIGLLGDNLGSEDFDSTAALSGIMMTLDAIKEMRDEATDETQRTVFDTLFQNNLRELKNVALQGMGVSDFEGLMDSAFIEQVRNLEGYRTGTKGFVDFGDRALTFLHGKEAVIPENTQAASYLKANFDENWKPIGHASISESVLNKIEDMAMRNSTPPMIISAPTIVGPQNTNVSGGSNVSTNNVYGGGSSSLNYGMPGAIQ